MRYDIVRRVRWGNLALACVVGAALAGVVVWPLVSSDPPPLPPDTSRPLIAAEPPARPTPTASPVRAKPPPPRKDTAKPVERRKKRDAGSHDRGGDDAGRARRRDDGRDRERSRKRPARRQRSKRERPPATTPVTPPRVVPAAPANAPGGEFGFER